MKRACIYVFYDPEGIVDRYVEYMLMSIRKVAENIVVIVNGKLDDFGRKKLEKAADSVFVRDNTGFDCGAYKDYFSGFLGATIPTTYDEIILMNDSFYGPFFPWSYIFDEMETKNIDFWGLSRSRENVNHIQSFFLCLKKSVFSSKTFSDYWRNLPYPESLNAAVQQFEFTFTQTFFKNGFSFTSWLDITGAKQICDSGKNPFNIFFREIVLDYKYPILKRSIYSLYTYNLYHDFLKKIETVSNYDISMIQENLSRLEKTNRLGLTYGGVVALKSFFELHDKVYLYGHGKIAEDLSPILELNGMNISGYVVTTPERPEDISIKELISDEKTGIIIAMSKKFHKEIIPLLEDKFKPEQILFP